MQSKTIGKYKKKQYANTKKKTTKSIGLLGQSTQLDVIKRTHCIVVSYACFNKKADTLLVANANHPLSTSASLVRLHLQ